MPRYQRGEAPSQAATTAGTPIALANNNASPKEPDFKSPLEDAVSAVLDPAAPALYVDRDQLKQAFYNLIKNALQAMRAGGILRISTERTDTHLVTTFSDNGSGIAPDKISRIFEPYFTTKPSGSGLGLLVVRRIVREHGGDLQLESHEGRGTTVRLLLPLPERRVRLLPATAS